MIPILLRYCIPFTKSESEIRSSAHQPALFLTQFGMVVSDSSIIIVGGITIISLVISHCIAWTNVLLSISSLAHQPALFLIQSGTENSCVNAFVMKRIPSNGIIKNESCITFI